MAVTLDQSVADFSAAATSGQQVSLSALKGKQVVIYFYPKDSTPGCTTEACDFTENFDQFDGAGVKVLGISPDAPEALAKFRADHDLSVELLSDPSKATLKAYGVYGEKKNYGKVIQGVIRSTFLVNVDEHGAGTIEQAQYNVKATGHVSRILRDWDI